MEWKQRTWKTLQTSSQSFCPNSFSSTFSALSRIVSFSRLPSLDGIVIRTRIRDRWIGSVDLVCNIFMQSSTCIDIKDAQSSPQKLWFEVRMCTHLRLGTFPDLDAEASLRHPFFNHSNGVWPLSLWIDTFLCDHIRYFFPEILKILCTLLLAYLKFAFL